MTADGAMALASDPDDALRDPAAFVTALDDARRARQERRQRISADRVVAALAAAANDWLRTGYELRRGAVCAISQANGWQPDMVATGIGLVFAAVTESTLRTLAEDEAGGLAQLSPPALSQRRGPAIVYQALAGNVPGQGIPPIVAALLAGAVVIIRDSVRQPALTAGFRRSIAAREPVLARMIVPIAWRHGDATAAAFESEVVATADRIELHGSDETLAELAHRYDRARAPASDSQTARITLHGSRVSIGVVPAGADLAAAAAAFALDIALYEGLGCLTPHVLIVEGDTRRAHGFATGLADALRALEARWPRARAAAADEAARRRFIDRAELEALGSERSACLCGPDGAWCVSVTADRAVAPGPGRRCVRVVAEPSLAASSIVQGLGRGSHPPVAAVGVAGGAAALPAPVRERIVACAPTILLEAGHMQAPPLHWHQDGVRRLGDLLGPET